MPKIYSNVRISIVQMMQNDEKEAVLLVQIQQLGA